MILLIQPSKEWRPLLDENNEKVLRAYGLSSATGQQPQPHINNAFYDSSKV